MTYRDDFRNELDFLPFSTIERVVGVLLLLLVNLRNIPVRVGTHSEVINCLCGVSHD